MNMREAGRELDALIAEKVMHLERPRFYTFSTPGSGEQTWLIHGPDQDLLHKIDQVPAYSTDIAAAWQVVEKMTGNSGDLGGYGPDFQLSRVYNDPDCKKFVAEFSDNYGKTNWKEKMAIKSADTAPMAIVLAALKAVDK